MRRLTFVALLAALLGFGAASPASAAGERLGCFVNTGQPGVYWGDMCFAERPQFLYNVHFRVLDAGPGPYSFTWDLTNWERVVQGCTSTSDLCIVRTSPSNGGDLQKQMSVTYVNQATGESAGISVLVYLPCVQGVRGVPNFC